MKKIINILSIISLTTISSLSVISCAKKEIPKLTLAQEKIDIINAINLKNTESKDLNVKIDDITMVSTPTFDVTNISYDITIKQDAKSFLNNNFTYRIPEVIGNFDISNNKITNKIFKINYFPGKYYSKINDTSNILTGTTNDFTLVMNPANWVNEFLRGIDDNDVDQSFKNMNLYNSNIILQNNDWINIINKLNDKVRTIYTKPDYAICLHIIRKPGQDFEIAYTNLKSDGTTSMPYNPTDNSLLHLFAFKSSEDIEDGSLIKTNNKFITLNKDILSELKDVYDAKLDNQDYGNKNWNVNSIVKILENNNYCNTNLSYDKIEDCIYNNWNINIVNNFLSNNYSRSYRDYTGRLVMVPINYLTLQYDKDNNYVKNNLNI